MGTTMSIGLVSGNISVILCIDIDVKLDVCKYIVHQWLVYIHVVSVKGDLHL